MYLLSMPLVIIFGNSAPKMLEGGQLRYVQKLMIVHHTY